MIHQLNEISEDAGESIPTVNDGMQVVEVEASQVFLDFTNNTLFWVFAVGVRYAKVSFVTYGEEMVSSVSGDINEETPAVAVELMLDVRSAEELASLLPDIVIISVVIFERLAEPDASIVATATPDSL